MNRRIRDRLAAVLSLGTVVIATVPPAASAASAPAASAPATALPSGWALDAEGRLGWHSPSRIPIGDARLEIRADGTSLGLGVLSANGRIVTLNRPGVRPRDPSTLQVLASGRRLDAVAPAGAAPATASPGPDLATFTPLPPSADPGRPGPYRSAEGEYRLAGIHLEGLPRAVEGQAVVVAPVGVKGASKRLPLALFLHGRGITCYVPAAAQDATSQDWPCPSGYTPVPSYRGFLRTQHLLASQGWITVSISANGINGQDGDLLDGGAAVRAALVREHLHRWAQWSASAAAWAKAPAAVRRSGPLPDLARVLLVGHSRGGEGVNRAALDSATTAVPWRIAGQVLIGATDFGRGTAPGVPTQVLLPYCDGDVFDLQSQSYVDDSRHLSADRTLRSAVLVLGANHDFFNSEWTPGTSKAPASDDAGGPDPTCGTSAPQRLSGPEQQAVGATYVAAAAHVFVDRDARVLPLLDGSRVRAPSAGRAVVLSHALGGLRMAVAIPGAASRLSGSAGMRVATCGTEASTDPALTPCGGVEFSTPHFPAEFIAAPAPTRYAAHLTWSKRGGTARLVLTRPVRIATAGSLELRVIAPPGAPATRFDVRLTDTAGHTAVLGTAGVTGLPAPRHRAPGQFPGRWWAQAVRLPLGSAATAHLDLNRVAAVEVVPASGTAGQLWVLDAWARTGGLAPSRQVPFVRLDVGTRTVREGNGGRRLVDVPIRVSGPGNVTATVWFAAASSITAEGVPIFTSRIVPVKPGTRRLSIPVPVTGNRLDDADLVSLPVYVRAGGAAACGQWAGVVTVLDDDPTPPVTIAPAVAREGQELRWTVRLARASNRPISITLVPVPVPSPDTALTTADLPKDYVIAVAGGIPHPPVPLTQTSIAYEVDIPPGRTSAWFSMPTLKDTRPEGDEVVLLRAEPTGPGSAPGLPVGTTVTGTVVDVP